MCFITCFSSVYACDEADSSAVRLCNSHGVRVAISDGFLLNMSSLLGMGLSDVVIRSERTDSKSSGVWEVGYRYSYNRFRLGADICYAGISSKVVYWDDKNEVKKENYRFFMLMPAMEVSYYKKKYFEMYGMACVGVAFSSYSMEGLGVESKFDNSFAFQINPVAMRFGNNRVAAFIEAGIGYKGFFTVGVNMNF